jgi:transcriptional regulator with XRE-family HTH domain
MGTHRRVVIDSPAGVDAKDGQRVAFAKALNKHLLAKGWSQTELARRAKVFLPKGGTFGRHNISVYCRGVNLPNQVNADAIAKALGVTVSELITEEAGEILGQSPVVKLEMQRNSRARLQLDVDLPTDVALQIAALVNGAKEG